MLIWTSIKMILFGGICFLLIYVTRDLIVFDLDDAHRTNVFVGKGKGVFLWTPVNKSYPQTPLATEMNGNPDSRIKAFKGTDWDEYQGTPLSAWTYWKMTPRLLEFYSLLCDLEGNGMKSVTMINIYYCNMSLTTERLVCTLDIRVIGFPVRSIH